MRVQFQIFNLSRLRNKTTLYSLAPLLSSRLSTNAIIEIGRRKERFNAVLPGLVDSLITSLNIEDVPDAKSWIRKVLDYNIKGGKLLRGLSTVMAYELIEKPENITDESLRLSRVMGWCVEMFQGYGLLIDDIMDRSVKRRGVPCWHTLPSVGLRAVNDSVLIYASMNHVLRTHFAQLPQYRDITALFNETLLVSSAGQHLDYTLSQRNTRDYSSFTIQVYNSIAKYKSSYYTFRLPVLLGMLLANCHDKEAYRRAEEICFKIGSIFQMQDDFIDVFRLESVTGKLGSDIQEGKCTWLAATALQRCSDAQRRQFTSYYGSSDPQHVDSIIRLYVDLDLPRIYKEEERERYYVVVRLAKNFGDNRASELFLMLLNVIYKRNN